MRKFGKKILAGVVCASLICSPITQSADTQAAETQVAKATLQAESTDRELKFTLSEQPKNNISDQDLKFTYEAVPGTTLYLRNKTAFNGIGASQTVYPLDEWSGVWYNNEKLTASDYVFATNESAYPVFYARLNATVQKNDRMVIRGAWQNGGDTYRFHMNTITYDYDGTKWVEVTSPDVTFEEGATNLQGRVELSSGTNLYLAYDNLKTIIGMESGSYDAMQPVGTDSGIYVNGVKSASATFIGAGWGNVFVVKPEAEAYVIGETTVRVQGIWSYNGKYFSVKTQQFKYTAENTWSLDETYTESQASEVWSGFAGAVLLGDEQIKDTDGGDVRIQISDRNVTSARIILPQSAKTGDVVTIGGDYETNTHSVTIEPARWEWNGTAWETYVPKTKVTVTPADENTTHANEDVVYLALSTGTMSGKYQPVDGSVKLDGVTLNNKYESDYTFTYAGWGSVWYVKLTHIDTSKSYTYKEGSILTIGGTFKNTEDSSVIEIPETKLVCSVRGTTYTWSLYAEKIQLSAPVVILSDDTLTWEAVDQATGYEISVNGTKKADVTENTYNLKNLKLGVGTYKITVTAVGENAVPATSDEVVYSIVATKVTVSVDPINAENTNDKILYLKVPNSLAAAKYEPTDGVVSLNGISLRYQADVYKEVDYAFNRQSDGLYYIQLTNNTGTSYAFRDKSIVTIGGTFKGSDDSYIEIEETHLVCNYTNGAYDWNDVSLLTPGDIDGNGTWETLDLIRLKRYIKEDIAKAYLQVTDLNGDGKADENDVRILRKWMLGTTEDGAVATGKYLSDKNIQIFADGPVVQTDETLLKNYFNAGFTSVLMTQDYICNDLYDSSTGKFYITDASGNLNADYADAIRAAMKYGDVMVRNYGNNAAYFTENTYKQLYDLGVRQFYIWDEPEPRKDAGVFGTGADGDLPTIADMAKTFASALPSDATFHVNLLPSYGTKKANSWTGQIGHSAYVDQYVSDVMSKLASHGQTLSIDNYPLLANGTIRTSYLSDLWYIASQAKQQKESGKDVTVNYCVQAFKETDNTQLRVPENRADISFQINAGLALGAESFEYFEYYDWSETDAITGVLTNGLYDAVKSVNRELLAWDHVIMAFDWQGVKTYNVGSSYLTDVTQLGNLQGMTVTADKATLVGEYKYAKDSDTDYGYMITNFTDPSANQTDTVTVTVKSGQTVLVYRDGVGSYMTADTEGKLSFALGAGEAVFVITE